MFRLRGLRGAAEIVGLPWSSVKSDLNRLFEMELANEIIVMFANGRREFYKQNHPGNLVELLVNSNGIIVSRLITIRVDSEGQPLTNQIKIQKNIGSTGSVRPGEMVDLGPINPNQPKGEIIDLPLPGESVPQFPNDNEYEFVGPPSPMTDDFVGPPVPSKGKIVPLSPLEQQASNQAAENIRISNDPSRTLQQPQPGTKKAPWLTPKDIKNFIDVVFVGYSEYQKRAIAGNIQKTQGQGKSLYVPASYVNSLQYQRQQNIWPWILGGLALIAVGGAGYYALKKG